MSNHILSTKKSAEANARAIKSSGCWLITLYAGWQKLDRMKRRIKKDNQRRELLNIPVPESEAVEVPDSDTEKEKDGEDKAKEEKPKEEGKPSERHSHREERSAERRRTPPPRRRPSPPRYRGYVDTYLPSLSISVEPACV